MLDFLSYYKMDYLLVTSTETDRLIMERSCLAITPFFLMGKMQKMDLKR